MLRLETFKGQEVEPFLDAIGALRITIFREYPYLYDGSLEYERDYLQVYPKCPRSMVALAFHGDAVVGATTCMPMADESPDFQAPFIKSGCDLSTLCYLGESLLLPSYRGRGMGRQFFKQREEHARSLGLAVATFCAVNRPSDHPLRPAHYHPLDPFWMSLGYCCQPSLQATFSWKEVHEEKESPKTLTFWTKELA